MSAPPKLATRQLGKDGPQVTAIGFGLMSLSSFYGTTISDDERMALLDGAYALGENNWDSADIYGDSEDMLGRWFKKTGNRDEIFLATKFGWTPQGPDGENILRSDPEWVKKACAKSLERLGIDCIDLYYCHRVDQITPIEKTIQAMVELKNEGKIKYLGLSECSAETLRRACAVHHISAIQVEYSPFVLDIEDPQIDVLRTARELGVAIVIYSPLGHGFVNGLVKSRDDFDPIDIRLADPRFSAENFPKNLKLVDDLLLMAKGKGCSPGQLTLAWELAQGDDFFPIPGTKKLKYIEDNIKALDVKLTIEEVAEIREAISACGVHGDRYPADAMKHLFGDTPQLS